MKKLQWNTSQLHALAGAIKQVSGINPEHPQSLIYFKIIQKFFLAYSLAWPEIHCCSPVELASLINDNEHRKQALEFLVIAIYFNEHNQPQKVDLLKEYARALKLSELLIKELQTIYNSYHRLLSIIKFRNNQSLAAYTSVDNQIELQHYYLPVNELLAARYSKLAQLTSDSLGYALYKFYRNHKFPLPGAAHSVADKTVLLHDISRLICGYTSTTSGNLATFAFQSGNTNSGGLIIALLSLFDHYTCPSRLERPLVITRKSYHQFWQAMDRGRNCTPDLLNNWDYESYYPKSLNAIRYQLNLLPRA